jgi:hypothetical protein
MACLLANYAADKNSEGYSEPCRILGLELYSQQKKTYGECLDRINHHLKPLLNKLVKTPDHILLNLWKALFHDKSVKELVNENLENKQISKNLRA